MILLKIIIVTIIIIFSHSCNSVKKVMYITNSQYPILDSLSYVIFPDDDYSTDGNYYFQKIISCGDNILPYLIEKISDTTETKIRAADFYNYNVGDIAVRIIPYINNEFNLRDLILKEFKDKLYGGAETDFFYSIYTIVIFGNSQPERYQNMIRLYNCIKSWYKEQQKVGFDKVSSENRRVNYEDSREKNKFTELKYPKIYCCGFETDSMQYIHKLPNDCFVTSKGDSICERIINKDNDCIILCLIDKITDETKTQIRNGNFYEYTVGDAAVFLLLEIYKRKYLPEDKMLPLRKILISELYNNEDDGDSFESLYISTFASQVELYQKKVKLQKRIREWYKNDIRNN